MPLTFSTKAQTLDHLSRLLTTALVLPQVRFTVGQWQRAPQPIIKRIKEMCSLDNGVIVRSSSSLEDQPNQSMAGKFASVTNVQDEPALDDAITTVARSYGDEPALEQVFVQPMLRSVILSGVAFGMDPTTGSPYRVINYDDTSGLADTVTAGGTNDVKTYYIFKHAAVSAPQPLDRVLALINELEALYETDLLDIEFAFTCPLTLYLLQARPLPGSPQGSTDPGPIANALTQIQTKIEQLNMPHPYLHGDRTVLGVMPDWNPAEMIGVRPRPLTLSLYRDLITDSIWAYQRDNYGYRNLRSFPLMVDLAGQPYVDVRVDFNSFIPEDLTPALADRLVGYYVDQLIENPDKHDKVEFEIIHTCYTFDLPHRLENLRAHGFDPNDCQQLADSLRHLTNRIIHSENGLWMTDAKKIQLLQERQEIILRSSLDEVSKIYWLLEDCKRYGTLPFAGLARAAFIAVQMLRSLVNVGVLSQAEYDDFMGSLNTVSSRMANDLTQLDKAAFLKKYGHLRPGTYDILSPRYDDTPDHYFRWQLSPAMDAGGPLDTARSGGASPGPGTTQPFRLSIDQLKKTESHLKKHGLDHDAMGLYDFIRSAIEYREQGKFVFTRSLSAALSLIGNLGHDHGLTLDDLSYVDIGTIQKLYASSQGISQALRQSIDQGKRDYAITSGVILPPVISDPLDAWAFHLPPASPNFITQKTAVGQSIRCDDRPDRFNGNILFIPSADPGYDWIFSHRIAALITMYGGANSHMAIRAGERGIPAVIGAGQALYNRWSTSQLLEVNCMNRQVKVLR